MASLRIVAERRALAMQRLGAAKASLAEKHGVEFVKPAKPIRDEELARVVELEELADLLEDVQALLSGEKPVTVEEKAEAKKTTRKKATTPAKPQPKE